MVVCGEACLADLLKPVRNVESPALILEVVLPYCRFAEPLDDPLSCLDCLAKS
jgi:hypothetical protein